MQANDNTSPAVRTCKVCGEQKTLHTGFYPANPGNGKGYYHGTCKLCMNATESARAMENRQRRPCKTCGQPLFHKSRAEGRWVVECPTCILQRCRDEEQRRDLPDTERLIPLPNDLYVCVDSDDYEQVAKFKWQSTANGYAVRTNCKPDGSKSPIFLHRVITQAPDGVLVDHINRIKLDCRKSNLRFCDKKQNAHNRDKLDRGTVPVSRHMGVTFHHGKWCAALNFGKTRLHLGIFDSEDAAGRARDSAARHFRGEFASLNFPDEIPVPYVDSTPRKTSLSSAFRGVCWEKGMNKWSASIRANGKQVRLGHFKSEEEAARAYDNAVLKHGLPLKRLNFQA